MTTPHQHSENRPSARMLNVLRDMAAERGVTYEQPATAGKARAEFRRLKAIPRSHREEARNERAEIRAELAGGDASAVRDEEIDGYGSEAAWSKTIEDAEDEGTW